MRFRNFALASFACLALAAFAANTAQAAQGDGWTIGTKENQTTAGTLIPNGTHEEITCHKHEVAEKESPGLLVVTSTLLGTPIEVTFEKVDCLRGAGSTKGATIDNSTSKGHSEGVFTFTEVKVVKPADCEVGGPTHDVTTEPLTDEVIMDPTAGSTVIFDRFFPEAAANVFMSFTFEGDPCPIRDLTAVLKGSVCGEMARTSAPGVYSSIPTGTLTAVATLRFGAAQQTTGNSGAKPCALTLGTGAAQFTGAIDIELESHKPFGAD